MSALKEFVVSELSGGEILLPVKKLWTAYVEKHPDVSLQAFTAQLAEDDRIEFVPIDDPEYPNWDKDEIAEHEADGRGRLV